jgi:ubiquinone/menaquinone biosynthesis C-methylase UbiE
VGFSTQGDFVVKSNPSNTDFGPHFALLDPGKLPLIAGLLTDRNLELHWPDDWLNYEDCTGKRVLDHCCGGGGKVAALRQQGIEAHGVDIAIFGASAPPFLHYGRAEKLPFVDGAFDRVESRMGIFIWGQDNKQMCREALSEMIRVTADGGSIRICPVREALLQELVSERTDIAHVAKATGTYGAFELFVRHPI